jgi:hypothetical protein
MGLFFKAIAGVVRVRFRLSADPRAGWLATVDA